MIPSNFRHWGMLHKEPPMPPKKQGYMALVPAPDLTTLYKVNLFFKNIVYQNYFLPKAKVLAKHFCQNHF